MATVEQAAAEGWTGVKHMTRIDLTDPSTAPALELLGQVLERAAVLGLDALVEPLSWRDGRVARDTDSIVFAAIVAHDLGRAGREGPGPRRAPGTARVDAVARIVSSVGVPVLFLGGPRAHHPHEDGDTTATAPAVTHGPTSSTRSETSWPAGPPDWRWVGSSTRTPTPPRWPVSSARPSATVRRTRARRADRPVPPAPVPA